MKWLSVRKLLEDSADGWSRHRAPRLSAAMAFYTLLSLMPLVLLLISIAGLIYGPRAAQAGVLYQLQLVIGLPRAKIIQALLEGAQSRPEGVLAAIFGVCTLLFGASSMLTELRDALNTVWEVAPRQLSMIKEVESLAKERLWSFGLLLAIGVIVAGSLALSTTISALGGRYASQLPASATFLHVVNAALSFLVATALFAAIYKVVPDVPIEWRDVAVGAAVTSLCFTLSNILVGIYLAKASFSSTYGAAASTVLLAVWVYYSSLVFFFGAEFTRVCAKGRLTTLENHEQPARSTERMEA